MICDEGRSVLNIWGSKKLSSIHVWHHKKLVSEHMQVLFEVIV
jgi:hypothetical protein